MWLFPFCCYEKIPRQKYLMGKEVYHSSRFQVAAHNSREVKAETPNSFSHHIQPREEIKKKKTQACSLVCFCSAWCIQCSAVEDSMPRELCLQTLHWDFPHQLPKLQQSSRDMLQKPSQYRQSLIKIHFPIMPSGVRWPVKARHHTTWMAESTVTQCEFQPSPEQAGWQK